MRSLYLLGDADAFDLLSELARRVGFDEVHRGDAVTSLGANDCVVVGAPDPRRASALVAAALRAGDPAYLGICATDKDAMATLLKLAHERVPKERLDRIAAPAGLGVGAATADELAVAIAAELIAVRRKPDRN